MSRVLLAFLLIGLMLVAVGLALNSKFFFWLGVIVIAIPLIIVVGIIALIATLLILMLLIFTGAKPFVALIELVIAIPLIITAIIIAILLLIALAESARKRLFVKRKS